MMNRQLMVDWKGLKELGWPYSRAHTWRLMDGGWENAKGEWVAVERRFPPCARIGNGPGARLVWPYQAVLEYFQQCGLTLPSD